MQNTKLDVPRVLIVDDERQILALCESALARHASVTSLTRGADAFQAARTLRPDVSVLDLAMPGVDGWQVCREMKQHPTLGRNVRVVMVTALDDWVNKRQALQTGADDFVEKPFELPKLASTVERNVKLVTPNTGTGASTAAPTR